MGISEVIHLLSGVALFLFGMTLMGDGLKRVSGSRLEPILFRVSGTPLRGMLLGVGVTAVIQSSSATSVMVVGFVNSRLMKVRQALSVILGAIFGTSITGWLICLSYLDGAEGLGQLLSTATLTGLVAIVGIGLRMFSRKQQLHHIGDIMLGFAVLMFGMSSMSDAVSGLGSQPWFTTLLTTMTNPLLGILAGAAFSAMLQSASAAVGIVQALSVTGAMTLETALPLLMGIAIGASLPVLLSALGANVAGKRTAVGYLVASFMGVMVCASLFYIAESMCHFPFMSRVVDPVTLALLNTILRLAILLLLAPFTDVLEAVSELIIPDKKGLEDPAVRLEERFLSHPALAIEQSRQTIGEMAATTEKAIEVATGLIARYREEDFHQVEELEAADDHFEDALGTYLVKLTGRELSDAQGRTVSIFLHTLSDFERISDHALNLAENAREMEEKQLTFTPDAMQELSVIIQAVREALRVTNEAFVTGDLSIAQRVEPLEEVIDDLCDEIKLRHVDRLQKGLCTMANGFVINDLITNLERVSDHCSNIAVAMLELEGSSFDTHEYLGALKERRAPAYEQHLREYRGRYALA